MTEEEILHRIEAEMAADEARFREFMLAQDCPEAIARYDERMRLERLGIAGARRAWHSISPAQRRTLAYLGERPGYLLRNSSQRTFYDYRGEPHAEDKIARVATVRNLADRELLSWDGGAFDPERKVVLTERGRFVLKHGPMPNGEPFTG